MGPRALTFFGLLSFLQRYWFCIDAEKKTVTCKIILTDRACIALHLCMIYIYIHIHAVLYQLYYICNYNCNISNGPEQAYSYSNLCIWLCALTR